ncbi:hypothetical protein ACIRF8_35750 [Streptomyces sp. NPDC102406]|uniref:hypothetical protein n=1 Tax=Streptomyces sp. NPDC102406 TaxID=3366171 RepID=UPI0037F86401
MAAAARTAYALFEVAVHALNTAEDPTDRRAVAAALGRARMSTMAGVLDWTCGPVPNVATVALAGGQRQPGSRHDYELTVVSSTHRRCARGRRPRCHGNGLGREGEVRAGEQGRWGAWI